MVRNYAEEEYLMLSGIQHMAFCDRQWALIHIEQQWQENRLTVEGKHLHERPDDPFENESRRGIRITRGVPIVSSKLGLRGISDVVEYERSESLNDAETIGLEGRSGKWKIIPIEYKHGKPKNNHIDSVQLCAQAMCLEEMFNTRIGRGYIYYNTPRRREHVIFNEELRKRVEELSAKMHVLFEAGIVPKHSEEKYCMSCSLYDICQPGWKHSENNVSDYLSKNLFHKL